MQKRLAFAGTGFARRGAPEFLEHVFEFGHVFKAFVDRRKTHVRDRVQLPKLVHHEFAQTVAANFAFTAAKQLVFDPRNGGVNGVCRNRTLAQRQLHARHNLRAIELGAAAILLYYRRQREFHALIGGETLVAGGATPPAANCRPVFRHARIRHLRVLVPAEGAAHGLAVDRELLGQRSDLRAHALEVRFVFRRIQHVGNQVTHLLGLSHAKTARGHGRRAQTHAAGDERLFRIVRNRVLVHRDMSLAKRSFRCLTGDVLRAQVDQHHVAFGAARDNPQAALHQRFSQYSRVVHDLLLINLEFRRQRFLERNSLTGNHVHQRTALNARENSRVDLLLYSAFIRITPPRGPRRLLWVVVVTKSANGTGFG